MCSADDIHLNSADERAALDELGCRICELAAHLAAATCRWLLMIAEFDERGGWAEWGVKSCAHWLSWRCSICLGAGREHVRVARRLRDLAVVREAFAAGELSYSKVRALTRVATPEIEESLVEMARHATGAQLEKLVRGYRQASKASTAAARSSQERRSFWWDFDEDGSFVFKGRLPAEEGRLLLSALEAAEGGPWYGAGPREISAEAPIGGDPIQRRADRLAWVARAALEARNSERSGGDPCELVLHVDVETLAADEVRSQSEIAEGPTIAPETARRLGCDAAVVQIFERDGSPLSVGRRRRTIPPAIRRALRRRDDGCCFPGCTHRRFLHAHHVHHWARGGPTSLDNLVQLCSYHHRLVHEGGYCVERAGTKAFRFRRPDGREIPPFGPCAGARGPGVKEQNAALGLQADDKTCAPKSGGGPIDYGLATELLMERQKNAKPPRFQ
jgi:hypothetical protein